MSAMSRILDPVWAVFDPLWALIGRHMFLTAGLFSVALAAAALLHWDWFTLCFGLTVGTILMLKAEADRPEPPHVHLPPPSA
jgi:hypothetical protein